MTKMLPQTDDWSFESLDQYFQEIRTIAEDDFRLDVYPNQIEVISAEQMIDAYSSVGLPVNYTHWSFGKQFIQDMKSYNKGHKGLAYEIVINSNPCIAYLMEENTLPMQALVMAHACFGHNAFFKNNYLFKERTSADLIVDYMDYARSYIAECEAKYGIEKVEAFLDSCHALRNHGVDHYIRPSQLSKQKREMRDKERNEADQRAVDNFWDTIIPKNSSQSETVDDRYQFPKEPHENLLYFFEKYAPNLDEWQREILRIVRKIQEYFSPQRQTKVGNEGFATMMHYEILLRMEEKGLVGSKFMLEVLQSHTGVIGQLPYNHPYYSGINPYTLGFNILQDIKRMCENPTKEDEIYFPQIVGQDWIEQVQNAAYNYRDETLVQTFLSPKVMRDMKLFAMRNDSEKAYMEILGSHDQQGYDIVRNQLAEQYNIHNLIPMIEVVDVDVRGDRTLTLRHTAKLNTELDISSTRETLQHIQHIWDFDVKLISQDEDGNTLGSVHIERPNR